MALSLNMGFAIAFLALGMYCVLTKRNVIKTVIGIEIMAKGAALSFLAVGGMTAQVIVILAISIDAIIAALMLAMIVNAYRHSGTLDLGAFTRLRG
jgi:multicomponent Na+:H+ antiporter subunit C